MTESTQFAAAVEQYRSVWTRLARRIVGAADAEDVVQDALVSCWRTYGAWRGTATLHTWVGRAVLNRALDVLVQQRSRRAREQAYTDVYGTNVPAHPDARVYLHEFVATLTDREKHEFAEFLDGDCSSGGTATQRHATRQLAVKRFRDKETIP